MGFGGRLKLRARLVNYYFGTYNQDEAMRRWLKLLGFNVRLDRDHAQIGLSCSAVAGEAVAIMLGAYGDWWDVDCSGARSPDLVRYAYGRHVFTEEFTEGRAAARGRRAAEIAGGAAEIAGGEVAGGDAPRRQQTYRLGDPEVSARASLCTTPPPGACAPRTQCDPHLCSVTRCGRRRLRERPTESWIAIRRSCVRTR